MAYCLPGTGVLADTDDVTTLQAPERLWFFFYHGFNGVNGLDGFTGRGDCPRTTIEKQSSGFYVL